jgi:hypothetical protein
MGKKFIESFVEECYRQGLTEKQACAALEATMQKEAAFIKSAAGEYGDIQGLGGRIASIDASGAGNPKALDHSVAAPYGTVVRGDPRMSIYDPSDWFPMLGNWFEDKAGNLANFFIPGTYTPRRIKHDPFTSQQYLLDYTKNRRLDFDEELDAAVEYGERLRKKYGENDPRYKNYDPYRQAMDTMYAPIQGKYNRFNKKYKSERAALVQLLDQAKADLARNPDMAYEISSLQGQIAELDKRHATAKATYDRETAEYHDMFGGANGGEPKSNKHSVRMHTRDAIAANQKDLAYANDMLQHRNSGFVNRWLKPWNWAKSFESMDPEWERQRRALMQQNINLRAAQRDQNAMAEDLVRKGMTRETAEEISRGAATGKNYAERLEAEAAKARSAKKKKLRADKAMRSAVIGPKAMRSAAEIVDGTAAAKRNFGKAMAGDMARTIDPSLAPKTPAQAATPVAPPKPAAPLLSAKNMQKVQGIADGSTAAKRQHASSMMGNTAKATLGPREAAKVVSNIPAKTPIKKKLEEDAFV